MRMGSVKHLPLDAEPRDMCRRGRQAGAQKRVHVSKATAARRRRVVLHGNAALVTPAFARTVGRV